MGPMHFTTKMQSLHAWKLINHWNFWSCYSLKETWKITATSWKACKRETHHKNYGPVQEPSFPPEWVSANTSMFQSLEVLAHHMKFEFTKRVKEVSCIYIPVLCKSSKVILFFHTNKIKDQLIEHKTHRDQRKEMLQQSLTWCHNSSQVQLT